MTDTETTGRDDRTGATDVRVGTDDVVRTPRINRLDLPQGRRVHSAAPASARTMPAPSARRIGAPAPRRPGVRVSRNVGPGRVRWSDRLPTGWPLQWLLVGFPLWWVLGLTTFIFPILAVPMALELRRRRPVRFPPFFWMWALYLVWQVLSLSMLGASPPGTHAGSVSGRLTASLVSNAYLIGVTITLLYVGNLPARVSEQKIARWVGWFFLTVLAGGFLGVVAPRFHFTSALEFLLPHRLRSQPFVSAVVHPIAAQVQHVFGDNGVGRPAAPFGYTNSWGNAIGILILWFVAGWVLPARPRTRVLYAGVAASAAVPILLSLNRGLWIGLIVAVVWLVYRQLFHGRIALVVSVSVALAAVIGLFLISPAATVVQDRLRNGHSNNIRSYVAAQSINGLKHSPILGYGGTRHTNGSANSIAIGKTANCKTCGDVATGSSGSLWAIMFDEGLGGLLWYFGFFAACLWKYRRERSAISEAALCTIALLFVFMFFYNATPVAPTLTMIAVGVLWCARDARLARAPSAGK